MKNKSLYILLSLTAVLFVGLSQVRAQESTDSAETNDVVREKVQEKMRTSNVIPKHFLELSQTLPIKHSKSEIIAVKSNRFLLILIQPT